MALPRQFYILRNISLDVNEIEAVEFVTYCAVLEAIEKRDFEAIFQENEHSECIIAFRTLC